MFKRICKNERKKDGKRGLWRSAKPNLPPTAILLFGFPSISFSLPPSFHRSHTFSVQTFEYNKITTPPNKKREGEGDRFQLTLC